MWLYHLHWQTQWKLDGESAAVVMLFDWALGAFCCGIALKLALLAWLARR
jgi:hypothetical protein